MRVFGPCDCDLTPELWDAAVSAIEWAMLPSPDVAAGDQGRRVTDW